MNGSLFINQCSQVADISWKLTIYQKNVLLAEFFQCLFLSQHLTWKHFKGWPNKMKKAVVSPKTEGIPIAIFETF